VLIDEGDIMDKTIAAAIISASAALLGVVIGVVIGGVFSYRATKSIERRKILSEKYEVIYNSSVQIRDWLKNENARWLLLAEPPASVNPAVEGLPCPIEKLIMMADLYAPSLEKEVSTLMRKVDAIKSLEWEYADSQGQALEDITMNTYIEDDTKADTAHNDMVNALKKLTKTNLLW
jgi:hypothetical protein